MRLIVCFMLAFVLGCPSSEEGERHTAPLASSDGYVSILSLNVAGLPDFMTDQDNPKMRLEAISREANKYVFVGYQEDFYYHRYLDQKSTAPETVRGSKRTKLSYIWSWWGSSGLTNRARWKELNHSFNAYSVCSGYLGKANDCWVPKGVMCSRYYSSRGVVIDFCNTHMDAGNSKADRAARTGQIEEYREALPEPVTEAPYLLIEVGDFNMRRDDSFMAELTYGKDIVVSDGVGFVMTTSNGQLGVTRVRGGKAKQFDGLSDHSAVELVLRLVPHSSGLR
jgi:hypothetical protein